jgi:hypothetical protein
MSNSSKCHHNLRKKPSILAASIIAWRERSGSIRLDRREFDTFARHEPPGNGSKRIQVVCTCPASEWNALRPAFDTVEESLSR